MEVRKRAVFVTWIPKFAVFILSFLELPKKYWINNFPLGTHPVFFKAKKIWGAQIICVLVQACSLKALSCSTNGTVPFGQYQTNSMKP